MQYARIENDTVVEGPKNLPISWRNISGLNLLGAERLKELGWLPVSDAEKPAYNTSTERLAVSGYDIGEDSVMRNWEAVALTAEQVKTIALARSLKNYEAGRKIKMKYQLKRGNITQVVKTIGGL